MIAIPTYLGTSKWKEMKDADVWCMQGSKQEQKSAECDQRQLEQRKPTLEQHNKKSIDEPGLGEGLGILT